MRVSVWRLCGRIEAIGLQIADLVEWFRLMTEIESEAESDDETEVEAEAVDCCEK